MIELIRREFEGSSAACEYDEQIVGGAADRYRQAFSFLQARRGQDVVNKVVRSAVWNAIDTNRWPSHIPVTSAAEADFRTCESLEQDVGIWVLPSAIDFLGRLLVDWSNVFGRAVLTTNFDPLIEIGVLRHGGSFYRTVLHDDGNLGQTVGKGTHIVHLHGYWYGYDTLHTPQQLAQRRPRLTRSLERVVKTSTLVVIGYGGWDDVVTRTLVELLSDSEANPEIMWAFHEHDREIIERSHSQLLSALSHGIGRGTVCLYGGIDCRAVLSDIHRRLDRSGSRTSERTDAVSSQRTTGALPTDVGSIRPEPDRPLFVQPWVGREDELRMLVESRTPIAFLTGLGGQGKSALAGRFLQQQAMSERGRFEFWDWRDCREESDRLNTQMLRVVERLGRGSLDASQIEATDLRALAKIKWSNGIADNLLV